VTLFTDPGDYFQLSLLSLPYILLPLFPLGVSILRTPSGILFSEVFLTAPPPPDAFAESSGTRSWFSLSPSYFPPLRELNDKLIPLSSSVRFFFSVFCHSYERDCLDPILSRLPFLHTFPVFGQALVGLSIPFLGSSYRYGASPYELFL